MGSFYKQTIKDAIEKIDANKYLIPSFQREFVWNVEKIENLFDSLMRGYPISSMLFWEVKGDAKKSYDFYPFLQQYVQEHKTHTDPKAGCDTMEEFIAILDGQQRLTSLFLGLKGTVAYHKKYLGWENNDKNFPPMKLYLNLSKTLNPDEGSKLYDFKFRTKRNNEWPDIIVEKNETWIKCAAVLGIGKDEVFNYAISHYIKKNDEINMLLKFHSVLIKDEVINYYLEGDVDPNKAVDIFVRINSGGKPLSMSDILLSLIVAGWGYSLNAREEIKKLSDEIKQFGFNIDHEYVIKAILYIFDKKVKTQISTFNPEFLKTSKDNWEPTRDCILELFKLLKSFGFNSSTLTSLNATLPILYYIYKKNMYKDISTSVRYEDQRDIMKKWILKTLLLKSFGASSDSTLENARKSVSLEDNKFPADRISDAIKQPKTLDKERIDDILSTQKDNPYAFSTLALFYPDIDMSNKFNLDHMHPVALFDEYAGCSPKQDKDKWARYNSIVNLQMLSENKNKQKNANSLEDWVVSTNKDRITLEMETYLPKEIDLSVKYFDTFFIERKKLLVAQLCNVLGIKIGEMDSNIPNEMDFDDN